MVEMNNLDREFWEWRNALDPHTQETLKGR